MAVTTTNLIQGPANLWIAPFGSAEPLDTAILTTPTTPWIDLGGTQDGVEVSIEVSTSDLDADQVLDVPGTTITGRKITVGTNLAEPTLLNFARFMNVADTLVTAGTGNVANTFEPSSSILGFQPVYRALLLDGIAPGGFRRRIVFRRTVQSGTAKMAYKKGDQTLVPMEWTAYFVSSSIGPIRVSDSSAAPTS